MGSKSYPCFATFCSLVLLGTGGYSDQFLVMY